MNVEFRQLRFFLCYPVGKQITDIGVDDELVGIFESRIQTGYGNFRGLRSVTQQRPALQGSGIDLCPTVRDLLYHVPFSDFKVIPLSGGAKDHTRLDALLQIVIGRRVANKRRFLQFDMFLLRPHVTGQRR